jgi:lipopolysaccharide transport system ATP-binding protein
VAAIQLENVTKRYLRKSGRELLVGHMKDLVRRVKPRHEIHYALRDVSLQIEHSECVAIVGSNGAGKTTLLSMIAGLAEPDAGSVKIGGRVAALMELGSGFHPDLTGAENLRLNAALLGLSRQRTDELMGPIIEFAGAGDYVHEPLRTYSSGMVLRLAFSVAVTVEPDILLIDEVLAVGDQAFQARCFERIREFRRQGRTLVFVSHAAEMIRGMCDKAIWLDKGKVQQIGPLDEVLASYGAR